MNETERRRTKPEFNGCIRYKRGEYCQPCVAMASNYTYVGIIDRRAVFHQYTRTPSPRELKLVEALRQHHKWHQDIGVVKIHLDNGEWLELDLSLEYSDSGLCEDTCNTLSAYDAPGSQGGEEAPISEEEAVEIMLACTQDHVARGGKAGKACMQLIYRALAKRLGWM